VPRNQNESVASEPKWRDELLARDWQQGSLLPVDANLDLIAWAHHEEQGVKQAKKEIERLGRAAKTAVTEPQPFRRVMREGERLVVLSQTCDVIKPPELFPLVDLGLAITTDNANLLAEADNLGSSRRYRLSSRDEAGSALLLDFGWRCGADKGALLRLTPDNAIVDAWSASQKERFARWLGRRYARPVLSEEDTKQIHDPIREAWKRAEEEELDALQAWNIEFAEIRFVRQGERAVHLYLLSPEREPDGTVGADMLGWLTEVLEDQGLTVTGEISSYHEFSVAQLEASQGLDLEWASEDEGEASGARPSGPND
jgi:hypothetical protein